MLSLYGKEVVKATHPQSQSGNILLPPEDQAATIISPSSSHCTNYSNTITLNQSQNSISPLEGRYSSLYTPNKMGVSISTNMSKEESTSLLNSTDEQYSHSNSMPLKSVTSSDMSISIRPYISKRKRKLTDEGPDYNSIASSNSNFLSSSNSVNGSFISEGYSCSAPNFPFKSQVSGYNLYHSSSFNTNEIQPYANKEQSLLHPSVKLLSTPALNLKKK